MASPDHDTGFGTTVAFGTSTMLNSLKLTDLNWNPGERTVFETTDYSAGAPAADEIGNATHDVSDVFDAGSFDLEYSFNPDTVLPASAVKETVTITWSSGATWVFTGAIVPSSGAHPMKERMTLGVTLRVCTAITVTAAA